jgi:hypothetical protein
MSRPWILAVVPALLLFGPSFAPGGQVVKGPPFTIRVVDHTGIAVPGVYVVADTGLTCRTNANGDTVWPEASIRRKGVRFELQGKDVFRTGATVDVTGGGSITLTVNRQN